MGATADCVFCGSNEISSFLSAPDRFHSRSEVYHLARCSVCHGAWLEDPPPSEEMRYHYGTNYHDAISSSGETNAHERWAKQRRLVSTFKGESLLDIGCSSGAFLSSLTDRSWQLYGIEIDALQANRATTRTGAHIFAGDLLDASFRPGSFDVITMFHVLEHFDHPHDRMKKIYEWLKPGGVIYLGLPNIESWEARVFGSYWFGLEVPRHLYHYTPTSLRLLLSAAGFREVWLSTPGCYCSHSMKYLLDAGLQKCAFRTSPAAEQRDNGLVSRICRKAFRLSVLPLAKVAEALGAGPNIEAVFQK